MQKSVLREKSKLFAKQIVFLCRRLRETQKEWVLANQLLKSATSIGANVHEAQYAQSKSDFISKLEIAQKECFETEYWLELLFETNCMEEAEYQTLREQCSAIQRLLIASVKTIKSKE